MDTELKNTDQEINRADGLFGEFLARRGMRYTKERRLILKAVMSRHDHFEPEDILVSLHAKGERVSTASVYRTLPLLIESGIVAKNPCDRMGARLEHVLGHDHHDHLVCVSCGKIVEFHNPEIEDLQEKVADDHGFKVEGHRLVISGYCSECR